MLRRRKPLRRISEKQQARRERLAQIAHHLGPLQRCEAAIPDVCTKWVDVFHHKLRRAQGGTDERDNLLASCAPCHSWIHDNPRQAYALGLLRRRSG